MILVITIISIFVLAGFVRLLNLISSVQICPVCAGVSGTWIWILVGMYFGMLDVGSWQLVVAIAMGGSVVGIAYQIEKKLSAVSGGWHRPFLRKMLFIPAGFVLVYSVLMQWRGVVLVSFAFLLLISFIFLFSKRKAGIDNKVVKELEEKMKNCC